MGPKKCLDYAKASAIEERLKDWLARMGINATVRMDYTCGGLLFLVVGNSKYYGGQRILEVASALVTENRRRLEDLADGLRANGWTVTQPS